MKLRSIMFILGFLFIMPARADSICAKEDSTCKTYLPIWKELVKKRSSIDQGYFDAHIKVLEAKAQKWNEGVSLEVRYQLILDWVKIVNLDQIITFIAPSASPYPALKIPLGKPLDLSQISRAADGGAWATSITSIPSVDRLKFASQEAALAALRKLPDGKNLKAAEINFNRPGMIPRNNGHPHLHARGSLTKEICVKGMIDLVTGEAEVHRDACIVY